MVRRQYMRDDLLARVWVGRVAAHDERGLWMWIAAGSPYLDIGAADGRRFRELPFADWGRTAKALHSYTWNGDRLMFHPPGEAYSVWFRFTDGRFDSWYVNLEEPASVWDDGHLAGVDTVDQDLDVVVQPDRTWRWKDEEEFAARTGRPGYFDAAEARAIRAEGERLVKLIEAGEFPFDGTHTGFRPDPGWGPLTLPAGWDRAHRR